MANRNPHEHDDHAQTEVLPAHLSPARLDTLADAASDTQRCYQEYVRSLDEVPVLVDVVREPPRRVSNDFRLGKRRDERKSPRGEAEELREQHLHDLEQQYAEYVATSAAVGATKRAGPRKPARKSGTQKKRAKRAERSARSKS